MRRKDKPLAWLHGEIKTPPFSQQARINDTIMDKPNIKRLQNQGWKFGDAADFLGLSEQESAFVELNLALSLNRGKKGPAKPSCARPLSAGCPGLFINHNREQSPHRWIQSPFRQRSGPSYRRSHLRNPNRYD